MLHVLYSNVIFWYHDYTHSSLNNWLKSYLVCCENIIIRTVNLVPFLLLWTMFCMLSRLGVHPSCLYNQSCVNPATTNHLVSLPRRNHASDGRRHSTSMAWESCCWPGAWHDSLMDVHGEGITDAKPYLDMCKNATRTFCFIHQQRNWAIFLMQACVTSQSLI